MGLVSLCDEVQRLIFGLNNPCAESHRSRVETETHPPLRDQGLSNRALAAEALLTILNRRSTDGPMQAPLESVDRP